MILIGVGSNLSGGGFATPRDTASAGLSCFPEFGVEIAARSRWYESEPVPVSDQPWFVNGVAAVRTDLSPFALLHAFLRIEARFGRHRTVPNAARTLDLDILDYDGHCLATTELTLPHPRLQERRFVLAPLAEIAPDWRHPLLRLSALQLLERLPPGQPVRVLGEGAMPGE